MAGPWEKYANTVDAPAGPWTKYQNLAWSDVPGQALQNAPSSAAHFAGNIVQAVAHPIATAQSLADIGAGALREGGKRVLPQSVFDAIDRIGAPAANERVSQTAQAAGQFFADRYGGTEEIKKTLATDPVGAVADAAAVLTGGGALASRAPGVVGAVGRGAQAAASTIDPLAAAGRTVARSGNLIADALGVTTGAGARPIREAYQAGVNTNPAFLEHMRGLRPIDDVVDMAEGAVGVMGRERGQAYNANMAAVRASQQPMNFQPVLNELNRTRNLAVYTSPTGRTIVRDQQALDTHARISNLVNDFMSLPAAERTPAAFDALKQSLGDIRQRTQQGTSERTIAADIYRVVRDEIVNQVPEYAAAMRDYGAASDAIGEMRRTLSINDRAATDTTLRKLQSTMRNNVNTNYGQRERLLDTLAQHEPNLPAALAGQSLNTWAPRGLARVSPMGVVASGAATMNPAALAVLPLTSPRLAGEASFAAGRAAGAAGRAATGAGVTPQRAAVAARGGYAAGALATAGAGHSQDRPVQAMIQAMTNGPMSEKKISAAVAFARGLIDDGLEPDELISSLREVQSAPRVAPTHKRAATVLINRLRFG